MTTRLMFAAILGGLLALQTGGHAQDKPPAPSKVERTLYLVRAADADALAEALAEYVKGEATVTALGTPTGDALLVSGSAAGVAEVRKVLEQADRPARTVAVEVTLAEVTLKKGEDGKEVPEPEFGGPAADLAGKLDGLAKGGWVASLQRINLTAVEGQQVSSTTGGSKPITTAAAAGPGGFPGGFPGGRGGGGGGFPRQISYHPTGATVKLTARIGANNSVVLDLTLNDSRVKPSDEEGGAAAIDTTTLTTRINVPAGRTVTAQAVRTDGKAGRSVAVVVVAARVIDPGAVASR